MIQGQNYREQPAIFKVFNEEAIGLIAIVVLMTLHLGAPKAGPEMLVFPMADADYTTIGNRYAPPQLRGVKLPHRLDFIK